MAYLKIPNNVLSLLFVRSTHVPGSINHLLLFGQELIKIPDAVRVLFKQLALSRLRLASLDEVQDRDGSSITGEQVVEVLRRSGIEGIHHRDCINM